MIRENGMMDLQLFEYVKTKHEYKACPVFRFYSLIMYGVSVDGMIPLPYVLNLLKESNFGDENTRDFDLAYANQLITHQPSIIDLMQVLGSLQFSEETFLLCDLRHPNVLNTVESLLKFIYERYGINSFIIKDVMDIDELKFSDFQTEQGYSTFIADLDRFKMTYFTKEQLEREVIE